MKTILNSLNQLYKNFIENFPFKYFILFSILSVEITLQKMSLLTKQKNKTSNTELKENMSTANGKILIF